MEHPQALAQAPAPTLIKNLASCNKSTRDRALRLLKTWFPSQQTIPDDDLKRLWKGLFYCVWHADKSTVQADLINSLSSLLLTLHLPLSIQYFSVFLITMRREWPGIDAHRLDKFYLLIRRFLQCFFLLLKKNKWDLELTRNLFGILEERTFSADDKLQGNGVNYHIASIFLEEFKCVLLVRAEILEVVFNFFFNVMGKSQDKILIGKIKCNVFDVLLRMGKFLLEKKKSGNNVEDEMLGFGSIALTMGFSLKFYELGSSPDCFQGNRKVLFGLHEEFIKLEKDLEMSGLEISIPLVEVDDDEDEVPKLIPIVSGETEACDSASKLIPSVSTEAEISSSTSKSLKKKKKVKKGLDGCKKKIKTKKNGSSKEVGNGNENVVFCNGSNSINQPAGDSNVIDFNESVISNLQMQFEKVAAEVGLDKDGSSLLDSPKISIKHTISKKRKRARSVEKRKFRNSDPVGLGDAEADAAAKTSEKSAKKVRFAKNNLVWKPHSPMPSQDLRLPPSVTPRGSALKKGVPPGPIREMPPATKKMKQKKKGRKGVKPIVPAIRRLRKLQALSN